MSEMVERVARALRFRFHGIAPDIEGFAILDMATGDTIGDWRDQARAAIEAMREPTDEMLRGHSDNVDGLDPETARKDWEAMIDAALATKREG